MAQLPNTLREGWASDPALSSWAGKNKFGQAHEMSDAALRKLAAEHKGKPVGLYIWESENHEVYVGISNSSVTTRLRQHVKNYRDANIQQFRFRADLSDRAKLRDIERDLIHDAIDSGFTVFNREHSAVIYGDSVFDDDVPVESQKEWFADPVAINASQPPRAQDTASATTKAQRQYQKFLATRNSSKVVDAVALYLAACTPFPVETEQKYWSVTCMPGWSKSRLVTLNMGYLEMFWVYEAGKKGPAISVGADSPSLPRRLDWLRLRRLGVKKAGPIHSVGGPNEEVLRFNSVDSFIRVMTTSSEVRLAVARFALDRMRKGKVSGRYRDAHDSLLAGEALSRTDRWGPRKFATE